jgi:hypothetical protein
MNQIEDPKGSGIFFIPNTNISAEYLLKEYGVIDKTAIDKTKESNK